MAALLCELTLPLVSPWSLLCALPGQEVTLQWMSALPVGQGVTSLALFLPDPAAIAGAGLSTLLRRELSKLAVLFLCAAESFIPLPGAAACTTDRPAAVPFPMRSLTLAFRCAACAAAPLSGTPA